MSIKQHNPPHPGEMLRAVYIEPFGLVPNQVAKKLKVSASTLHRLLNAESDVTPAMALKLSRVFGRSAESWLQMQDNYSLFQARKRIDVEDYEPLRFAAQA